MVYIRETMSRDEMFRRFPGKYLVVINSEIGIGNLWKEAGLKKGHVLAMYDTSVEAYNCDSDEIPETGFSVMHSDDYTEEVFNLGFIYVIC